MKSPRITTATPVVIEVGTCIYCRQHNTEKLSREHVIPRGIGGGIILRNASCEHHRKITHKFESDYIEKTLMPFKYIRKLSSSRPVDKRPTHFPLLVEVGAYLERRMVSVADYPDYLVLPVFAEKPGILREGQREKLVLSKHRVCHNRDDLKRRMTRLNIKKVIVQNKVPLESFTRTLAKIAHGIAVMEFGLRFAPLLLEIIEGKLDEAGWVIGQSPTDLNYPGHKDTHLYGRRVVTDGEFSYIVLDIKLFTNFSPTYCVVAGAFENANPPPLPAWPEMAKRTASTQER